MATKLEIGQRISTTDDTGIVDAIAGDRVTVRWDSLVVTTQPARVLLAAMNEKMATKCGDLIDYYTGACMRPATEAERNASREAAKQDGGAGVILLGADSTILAADDADASDAARCYVSE